MQNVITFPGLGLTFHIDRIAFSIGSLNIYWYGIIIAVGFLLGVMYCLHRCKDVGLKTDDFIDLLIWAVPIAIIGARAYYVVWKYNELYYYDTMAMFRIWDGGIAIYGAIIAGVLTAVVYCAIRRIRFGAVTDVAAMGLLIGQAIGRWGNFVNQEAYGGVTDSFLRMGIYVNGTLTYVQPTFLYESLWNVLGFLILHFLFRHRKRSGQIFLLYTAWYGLGRGVIEGMRTDSLYFFNSSLRISQFVGFFSAIVAIGVLIYLFLFVEFDPEVLTNPYLPKRVRKKKDEDEEETPEAEEEAPESVVISGVAFNQENPEEEADASARKDVTDVVREAAGNVIDAAKDALKDPDAAADEAVKDTADAAEKAVKDASDAAEEAVKDASDAAEETVKDASDAAEEAADAVKEAAPVKTEEHQ